MAVLCLPLCHTLEACRDIRVPKVTLQLAHKKEPICAGNWAGINHLESSHGQALECQREPPSKEARVTCSVSSTLWYPLSLTYQPQC